MNDDGIKFKAQIGDKVWIPSLESFAVIHSIWFSDRATPYVIYYFHNGEGQPCYIFASELELER